MEMEDVNPGYEASLPSGLQSHTEIQPSCEPGTEDQTQESYEPEDQLEDQTNPICEEKISEAPQDYQIESEPTEDAR